MACKRSGVRVPVSPPLIKENVNSPRLFTGQGFESLMLHHKGVQKMLAILYDIHGNLPALKEVIKQSQKLGVEGYLLGGDYVSPPPWAQETLDLLRTLPNAIWIRGNIERWLKEEPELPPHIAAMIKQSFREFADSFPNEEIEFLYGLPIKTELKDILFVHGSPLSDIDSFAPQPQDDETRMLAGIHDKTIVFGHSHQQFQRPGPSNTYLVNPGSVGMPLDGDKRGAWATMTDAGKFEFHRTEYDWQEAADAFRESAPGELGDWLYNRIINGKDT
jgi:predicted phosphodiesterase